MSIVDTLKKCNKVLKEVDLFHEYLLEVDMSKCLEKNEIGYMFSFIKVHESIKCVRNPQLMASFPSSNNLFT
uniref:Uncharacterized protein n=1 Tax=Heterorhabditis bacteriophora TaxID=37862 RepID=A0A1I7WT89_HETBA